MSLFHRYIGSSLFSPFRFLSPLQGAKGSSCVWYSQNLCFDTRLTIHIPCPNTIIAKLLLHSLSWLQFSLTRQRSNDIPWHPAASSRNTHNAISSLTYQDNPQVFHRQFRSHRCATRPSIYQSSAHLEITRGHVVHQQTYTAFASENYRIHMRRSRDLSCLYNSTKCRCVRLTFKCRTLNTASTI